MFTAYESNCVSVAAIRNKGSDEVYIEMMEGMYSKEAFMSDVMWVDWDANEIIQLEHVGFVK